jgi:hypothetical protein
MESAMEHKGQPNDPAHDNAERDLVAKYLGWALQVVRGQDKALSYLQRENALAVVARHQHSTFNQTIGSGQN